MTSLTSLCWYLSTSASNAPLSPRCTRRTRLRSLASALMRPLSRLPGAAPGRRVQAPHERNARASHPAPSFRGGSATAGAVPGHPAPRRGLACCGSGRSRSAVPLEQHLLDLGDRPGGVQVLRAHVGAVSDRVAAVEP